MELAAFTAGVDRSWIAPSDRLGTVLPNWALYCPRRFPEMDLSNPSEVVLPSVRGAVLRVLAQTTEPMSGRAIAAMAGQQVGYRRASQVLGELAEAGVVLREAHPPAFLYRLNRDHVAAEPIVMLADLRSRLLRRVSEAVSRWHAQPQALWLFGSAVRGREGQGVTLTFSSSARRRVMSRCSGANSSTT